MGYETCSGCRMPITGNHLACSTCRSFYDLLCANVNEQQFTELSNDKISSWVCLECVSKVPRTDNTHTPVRSSRMQPLPPKNCVPSPIPKHEGSENVTMRKKKSECFQQVTETLSLTEIRNMFCEEIERKISSFEKGLISAITKQVEEIVNNKTKAISDSICKLSERLTEFESKMSRYSPVVRSTTFADTVHPTSLPPSIIHNDAPVTPVRPSVDVPIAVPGLNLTSSRLTNPSGNSEQTKFGKGKKQQPKPGTKGKAAAVTVPAQELSPLIILSPRESRVVASPSKLSLSLTNTNGVDNEANEDWQQVKRKQPRMSTNPPPNVSRGTAAPGSTLLEASERVKYLHLFYVKQGTTESMVLEHLKTICGNDVCTVQLLKSRGNYASFKLGVPVKWSESILSPKNWAEDICIKPWKQLFRGKQQA